MFSFFLLLFISNWVAKWSEKILIYLFIFVFLNLSRLVLWPNIWLMWRLSVSTWKYCAFRCYWGCSVKVCWSVGSMGFPLVVSLLIFCLDELSITENGALSSHHHLFSPSVLLIFDLLYISRCSDDATYKFMKATSSWRNCTLSLHMAFCVSWDSLWLKLTMWCK